MSEVVTIIEALTNLTLVLSVLSFILAALVLIDCMFLYKRISLFRKRQDLKREATYADNKPE